MAARQSLSREPSLTGRSTRSRRSSLASNPNVFSDDYALPSPTASGEMSPISAVDTAEASSSANSPPRESIVVAPYPQIPASQSSRASTVKRTTLASDASSTTADSAMDRSLSTSTRFSITRPQSPYTGPTAPSHPYHMYPQVTRSSSIASESTLRPPHPETPFVPRAGPEHPYAMYTQNTVPEEDEDITAGGIPLGFPRTVNFNSSSSGSHSDVGDIVGSDGHIEQLPPYTRYADNTVIKGNMDEIHGPQMTNVQETSSNEPLAATTTSAPSPESPQPRETFDVEGEQAKKEGWKAKAQRKTCGGMPIWGVLLIVIVIILAAVIGGVIGGVVGNRQGSERALATATPQTTIWLDAVPTSVGPGTPPVPTGSFSIPLNKTENVGQCIANSTFSPAWDCLDRAAINITIQQPDPDGPLQAIFQDYTASDFSYGPQAPDFNGTAFNLTPWVDKDDHDEDEYGVAMYFYAAFDKLVIINGDAIPPPQKRSISANEVKRRGQASQNMPFSHQEKPWFCFWNSTINEFWIYMDKNVTTTSSSSSSNITPAPSSNPYGTKASAMAAQALNYPTPVSASTTFAASIPSFFPHHHNDHEDEGNEDMPPPTPVIEKRGYPTASPTPYGTAFPRMVKMVEKRTPGPNVQPYCQRMIITDGQIWPDPDEDIVCIDENEFPDVEAPMLKRDDVQQELQSNCICEWMS